ASRQLLDTAYRYARFLAAKKKVDLPGLGRKTVQLLSTRAKFGPAAKTPLVAPPAIRDDEGHETLRIESTAGYSADEPFVEFGIRPAFHDLLDPMGGYPVGASLELFRLRLRQAMSADAGLRVHDLTLIDIDSRAIVTELDRPLSWGISAVFKRESTYEPFPPDLRPQVGLPYALGESATAGSLGLLGGGLLTARLNGDLRLHADIK